MPRAIHLAVIAALCFSAEQAIHAQNMPIRPSFHLKYSYIGLGANLGSFQPTLEAIGQDFVFSYQQNSYWKGIGDTRIDTVKHGALRPSTIDSIVHCIKPYIGVEINKVNPCIMSGGIHSLHITIGIYTVTFSLANTMHKTALAIIDLLNEYTPSDHKIPVFEKEIEAEVDCWRFIDNSGDK